jgi:predicted nucleotidyltransferase
VEDVLVHVDRWSSRGPDYSENYHQQAQQLARQFAIMEGVVGVLLTGGLTFGEADRYSDIDLAVYLRQQSLRTWYFGEAPLPEGQSRYRNFRLDIAYLDYELEYSRDWTSTDVWRASRAEILYDPEGLIGELLESKKLGADAYRQKSVDLARDIAFVLDQLVPAWLYRGETLAAHMLINETASRLIELIHLANASPVPEPGWDVVLAGKLESVPEDLTSALEDVLHTRDLSADEASRRRYSLQALLRQCVSSLPGGRHLSGEAGTSTSLQAMLTYLMKHKSVDLDEFLNRFDRSLLIQSPAFDLVWIERQPDQTRVRFNHDRLRQIVQHELGRFLDSQQRLLRELASLASDERDS